MPGVLDGIRVLDFGRYIAGPFCAALLGDLGAEVIRVEKRDGSEDRYTTPVGADGTGAGYMQMNRNKLGITLDPMSDKGREIVRKLVKTADVVIANLPLVQLKQMGLDYDTLAALNPRIIMFMNSTFGSTGPYAERVGFDTVGQAMSGAMYLSGDGKTPMRLAAPVVDYGTATLGAVGVLAALLERVKSGKGQLVETALLHTALNFTDVHLIEQDLIKADRKASMNRHWGAGPSDCFKTKDGWIYIMAIGGPLFRRWARLMGEEDKWVNDPRFKDDQSRGDNGKVLSERTAVWCAERTNAEVLDAFEKARIPAGPIYSPQQALDDIHIKSAGFLQEVDYPGLPKPAPVVTPPVKLSRTPGEIRLRPPTLGEHTEQILGQLGYNERDIAGLRQEGVI